MSTPRTITFWNEDGFLQEADPGLREHVSGGAEEAALDQERGSLGDTWVDCDKLRLDGHRVSFITSTWGDALHVIARDEFTDREMQVLEAYFRGAEVPFLNRDVADSWDNYEACAAAIAYRGGRGYGYAITEILPEQIPYQPSRREVNALRTRTGAGMMDCKKALTETGGDAAQAAELVRKATRHRL